jgi:hypothetical protein
MLNSRGIAAEVLPQIQYRHGIEQRAMLTRDIVKAMPAADQEKLRKFKTFNKRAKDEDVLAETLIRQEVARDLLKAQAGEMAKAGMTTALGFNFFDLRGPAYLIYPVNTPFRNSLARMGRVNDGVGTAANWKASRNFGTAYIGVLEGQRNTLSTPDEINYVATYKEIGVERGATFTSQFAGEGYTDNVADEHLRGFHEFVLGEEGLMVGGNSGTAVGNNGFALGTANTPTAVLAGTGAAVLGPGPNPGTLFPNATNVSARVVELTTLANPQNSQYGYGLFPTVVVGLTPSYVRTNYDGSTTTVNGGMGAISASSPVVSSITANGNVIFTVVPKAGAVAWAWFIDIIDAAAPPASNAILSFITTTPGLTTGSSGGGTQAGNAAGLNTDHSFNTADFDGLVTYAANTGIWTNLFSGTNQGYGSSTAPTASKPGLTAQSNGRIKEFELIMASLWNQFQAPVQTIWCSADGKQSASNTILSSAGSIPTAFHWNYQRDSQNNILGGFTVSAYQSQFAMDPSGASAIPLRIHPMLPPGTFYFDISDNPYPSSRLPFVRGMLVQRDVYSIEWPLVTRQWTFGTYAHEVLAHNVPWITAVLTGVTPS